ncbi:hypothetical protein BC351_01200 [Paenibacillus ferrarius]|uniref:Uncharacterized protein n=1 Tax=Paenibacillus ferrarius TaxID=1469647 RepID=A0A1V4HSX2_9BACL|nr:hypothetical protein [Paenibacillus ferrarius]OPH61888.1 hypothetical protein BC351_01200 [Paenibacillus ferrarius]
MNYASPAHLNAITELKERASTVFTKIDEGIFLVVKDRSHTFSGRLYVNSREVIDELNCNLKVAILSRSQIGAPIVLHSNF